jgi:hypothetical protein
VFVRFLSFAGEKTRERKKVAIFFSMIILCDVCVVKKKKVGVPRKHVRDEKCDVFSSDLT